MISPKDLNEITFNSYMHKLMWTSMEEVKWVEKVILTYFWKMDWTMVDMPFVKEMVCNFCHTTKSTTRKQNKWCVNVEKLASIFKRFHVRIMVGGKERPNFKIAKYFIGNEEEQVYVWNKGYLIHKTTFKQLVI